jgi:hypothetical protein
MKIGVKRKHGKYQQKYRKGTEGKITCSQGKGTPQL